MIRLLQILFLLAVVLTAGCGTRSPKAAPIAIPQISLYERKLQEILANQEALFEEAVDGKVAEDVFVRRAAGIASDYDRLIAENADSVLAYISYGKFLRRVGRREDAHFMFSRANQLDPEIAVVKQQIGNYLAEEGQHAGALAFYMAAIELEPKEAAYHYSLGELYAYFGNKFLKDGIFTAQAIDNQMLAAFRSAAELDPGNLDFALRYGEAFYDLFKPDWKEALAVWEEISTRELSELEADAVRLHRSRVLIELGRQDEATDLLSREVMPPLESTRQELLNRLSSE